MTDIGTRTSHARLKPNGNGYAHVLASGWALLYRKRNTTQPGKWVLRIAKNTGGYGFKTLGTADDYGDGMNRPLPLQTNSAKFIC